MTTAPVGLRRMAAWAGARPAAPAAAPAPQAETAHCELCPLSIGEDHRHLLHLDERRIICVCETCWSMRSGDPEFRPPGVRTLWLEGFAMPDEVWAAFEIPIGLAFLLRSSVTGTVVALYPSPAGATESELELTAWDALCEANPVLERLEPDAEALIVNRTGRAPVRHRPDRPGLPARRARQVALGGHQRRPGPRRRDRRVLRRPARAGAGAVSLDAQLDGGGRPARHRAGVLGARRRAGRVRRDADAALRPARRGPPRARHPHDRALDADPDRPGAPVLRRRDPGAPRRAVRAAGAVGVDDAGLPLGARRPRSSRASPARRRSRSRSPCTYDLEVAASQVLLLAVRRRGPALVPLQRHGPLPRRRRPPPGRAGPVELHGPLAMPVDAWKARMAAYYPGGGWVRLDAATLDALAARKAAGGAPLLRRAGRRSCCDEPARRARRHAAVGGPPALPLHAGRDEERDADAVRHRLPARLRRGQPAHVRRGSSCSASRRGRRRSRRPCTSSRPARRTGSSCARRAPSTFASGPVRGRAWLATEDFAGLVRVTWRREHDGGRPTG